MGNECVQVLASDVEAWMLPIDALDWNLPAVKKVADFSCGPPEEDRDLRHDEPRSARMLLEVHVRIHPSARKMVFGMVALEEIQVAATDKDPGALARAQPLCRCRSPDS